MANFKSYVSKLDAAHRAAQARYAEIEKAWDIAQKEYEAASNDRKADETVKAISRGEFLKAQKAHADDLRELDNTHRANVEQISSEMRDFVRNYYLATPDKLDDKAMQLINSGIMTVYDLEHMAKQYSHNPVMLRIIGKEAEKIVNNNEKVNSDEKIQARQRAAVLRHAMRDAENSEKALAPFNQLASASKAAFGRDSVWAKANNTHWERFCADCNAAYDNFIVQPANSGE